MDDLDKYIETRKKRSPKFAKNFDKGYEQFKIGVLLKQARLEAGFTQEQVAKKLHTKKSAISNSKLPKGIEMEWESRCIFPFC